MHQWVCSIRAHTMSKCRVSFIDLRAAAVLTHQVWLPLQVGCSPPCSTAKEVSCVSISPWVCVSWLTAVRLGMFCSGGCRQISSVGQAKARIHICVIQAVVNRPVLATSGLHGCSLPSLVRSMQCGVARGYPIRAALTEI